MESGMLGMAYKNCTISAEVLDEIAEAKAAVQQSLESFPEPTTKLMRTWASPAPKHGPLYPMAIVTGSTDVNMSYKWLERSIEMNCGWGPQRDKKEFFSFDGLITMCSWLYAPIGASIGYFGGEGDRGKYEPCLKSIADEMKILDPATRLDQSLSKALGAKGKLVTGLNASADPVAQALSKGAKTLLQSELIRVRIHECDDRVTFCLELAVRTRLWNVVKNELIYEVYHVYTNPGVHPDAMGAEQPFKAAAMPVYPVYEVPLPEASPCFKPDALCGDSGKKMIAEALDRTLELSVQAVLKDIPIGAIKPVSVK
jgi:hypothetical protein